MKFCPGCMTEKPSPAFYKCRNSSDGLQTRCKTCQTDQRREGRRRTAVTRRPTIPDVKPTERWRPVVGYDGQYSISTLGRVRSDERFIENSRGTKRLIHPRILKPAADRRGYLYVNLWRGNRGITAYIHRIVLEAFVGPLPIGFEVRHLNGQNTDNRLENLKYGTRSENHLDSVRHGTHRNAQKTHCPRGHAYDGANTIIGRKSNGRRYRVCKECRRVRTLNDQR